MSISPAAWYIYPKPYNLMATREDVFNSSEIKEIIRLGKSSIINTAAVGLSPTNIQKDLRNNKVSWILPSQDSESLYKKISELISDANEKIFEYDLISLEALQYTEYSEGEYYKEHIDVITNGPMHHQRKLSFTVQLSDERDYSGGELFLKPLGLTPILKKKGSITFFNSLLTHEITPVIRGKRISLVGWVSGPSFR